MKGNTGTYFRTNGRAGLTVEEIPSAHKPWKARLVGRSDGGYNVGWGNTPAEAIDDLKRCYQNCIDDVENGHTELKKLGIAS